MPKYAHAPVVLAVIEIKHPRSDVRPGEAIAIKNALRPNLPFHSSRDVTMRSLELTPSGAVEGAPVTAKWDYYDSRTRQTRFGTSAEATTIETTEYDRWNVLLDLMRTALSARHEVSPLDGYWRVGLRYIDEIRAKSDSQPDWEHLIARQFLPPKPDGGDLVAAQQNCVVQYRTGKPGQTVTVRFGAVDAPPAVIGELRPDPPASGPYFLLDTDVAWAVQSGDLTPEMDVEAVGQMLDDLHSQASRMFEHVLTEELRKEFA